MKNKIIIALVSLVYIFCASSPLFADAKADIEETLEQLVVAAETYSGDDKKEERRSAMRTIIEPRFDFEEMAKRSLGAYWKKCSPQDQERFVSVFSDLLASTYLGKIDMIERNMVTVDQQKKRDNKAFVKTTVTYKGDAFGLDYKLIQREGAWKVYDVIIENIGLVANYRNEFAGIIRKEKFAGLINRLEEKVAAKEESTES